MTEPANPFAGSAPRAPVPDPCALVIFGATGDLTRRKLVPALYNLRLDGLIDPSTPVVGFSRRPLTDDAFRDLMREAVEKHSRRPVDPDEWERFASRLRYVPGTFDDADSYHGLASLLTELEAGGRTEGRRIYYLATPPAAYAPIIDGLGAAQLARPGTGAFCRVIIEKPFGRDLASARELNQVVARSFQEHQVYRIDHYLGKETVQNILVFRLGNGIFEPLWNRRYVDHVQITVAESLGVEGRATYYERAGVVRDMFQNHMMQLLCLVAMEPPVRFEADAVRDEKVKVLRALAMPEGGEGPRTVRGTYGPGAVGGTPVPGYRDEDGVAAESTTETYLAARLDIENWRWAGVPFFLRSGKRLARRVTEIALVFRRPPHLFFAGGDAPRSDEGAPNVLALRIQPDEGISLWFGSKEPGQQMKVQDVRMDFLYSTSFGGDPPEAYEHLLLDAIEGDSTLFTRHDEVELSWGIADALRGAWESGDGSLHPYPAGTWGPPEARDLLGPGRTWRRV